MRFSTLALGGASIVSRLFDDDAGWGPADGVGAGDFFPDARGDGAEDERVRVVGVGDGDRVARIRGLADLEVERNLAEKLGAEAVGLEAGATVAEDLAAAAAMRAQEIAHVLDDAE